MKRVHKVTNEVFKAPKEFPTIRMAIRDKLGRKRLEMFPSFMHMFINPSQPHSKMR